METINLKCPSCSKVVGIEPAYSTVNDKNSGHGTIVAPNKKPNELQCSCGEYLDTTHIVLATEIAN